jgi:peptide subunit release factor 1 (eRF1)
VRFRLGEAEELATEKLELDISGWREKHLVAPARPGVQRTRGSQRDVFQQRLEGQFGRLYREAADRIRRWIEKEQLCPVLVAGSGDIVERVWRELPAALRGRAALVKNDMSDLGLADLYARIEPELVRWKRAHELDLVARLVSAGNSRRAAVGIDETLQQLQEGKVRALVVAGGLGGKLFQCTACGWTDRSADRICSTCGGERRPVAIRAALPELARKFSVQVEVVSGEAGRKLREAGGLGAWLR